MTTTKNTKQSPTKEIPFMPADDPEYVSGETVAEVVAEITAIAPKRSRRKVGAVATEVVTDLATKRTVKAKAVKTPAKKAPAKKAAAKTTAAYDVDAVVARIKALRAEGVAWRPLSATLNDEGIKTVRGAAWSANGSTAFLLAKKNGIK